MVAVTQFLVERNLPFRGENEAIGCNSSKNGNFLGFIELQGKFDPSTKKHLENVKSKNRHIHYFSSDIQNELIGIISGVVLKEIVQRIRCLLRQIHSSHFFRKRALLFKHTICL